jgi:hypothetical protein
MLGTTIRSAAPVRLAEGALPTVWLWLGPGAITTLVEVMGGRLGPPDAVRRVVMLREAVPVGRTSVPLRVIGPVMPGAAVVGTMRVMLVYFGEEEDTWVEMRSNEM